MNNKRENKIFIFRENGGIFSKIKFIISAKTEEFSRK